MPDLHALLASSIVCALEEREHVIVAPGCADALCAALEPVVAQGIPSLGSPLRGGRRDAAFPVLGEDHHVQLQRALDDTAKQVAALLLATDHVDDIFADEIAIRRDVLRAMRGLLLGVQRGEVDVDEPPESGVADEGASLGGSDATASSSGSWRPPASASGSWRPPAPAMGASRGSWRPIARRSDPAGSAPQDDDAYSGGPGDQLGYFLDNLERSLSVLEEYGEGPPSAPATLGAHTEPPPRNGRAQARARRSSERKKRGNGASPKRVPAERNETRRKPSARSTARSGASARSERAAAPRKAASSTPSPASAGRRKPRAVSASAPRGSERRPEGSKRTSTPRATAGGGEAPRRRAVAGGARSKR